MAAPKKTWKCAVCFANHPVSVRSCDTCSTCYGQLNYNTMTYCRRCEIKYKLDVILCKICGCQVARRSWSNPVRPSALRRLNATEEQVLSTTKSTYKAVMLQ